MYLLNKNNDESIFKNFDGEQTLVSGNQGGYEYIKVIKGKCTDSLNSGVAIGKPITFTLKKGVAWSACK